MRISFETMQAVFSTVLLKEGFTEQKAAQCATIFAENSLDGVYSHGLNRFPTFVEMVRLNLVKVDAEPVRESRNGAIEQWNGNLGPGVLNAKFCMDRAVLLAKANGLGCVALRNTNHWMRAGTYGWQAANQGCIGICFTNTIAIMPAWGGTNSRLGNNPLVIAVPRKNGHVVLDMAMSQYSVGKLMQYEANNEELPLAGGYDQYGNLSTQPADIIQSKRILPIGFWKGSGLSLMLDLLATILSQGHSTKEISKNEKEYGVSQVFISINPANAEISEQLTAQIVAFTKDSELVDSSTPVSYPGENTLKTRIRNLKEGIPVNQEIWNKVLAL